MIQQQLKTIIILKIVDNISMITLTSA